MRLIKGRYLSTNPYALNDLMTCVTKEGEVVAMRWFDQKQFHEFCGSMDKLRDVGRFRDALDIVSFLGSCWCYYPSPECWPCEMASAMLEGKDFRQAIQPFLTRKGKTEAEVLAYWEKDNRSYDEHHAEMAQRGIFSCPHCGNFLHPPTECACCTARNWQRLENSDHHHNSLGTDGTVIHWEGKKIDCPYCKNSHQSSTPR